LYSSVTREKQILRRRVAWGAIVIIREGKNELRGREYMRRGSNIRAALHQVFPRPDKIWKKKDVSVIWKK